MAYTGIVLVSHSAKITEGIKDVIRQVIKDVPVSLAGGTASGDIGTNADMIQAAVEKADAGHGVIMFYDIGSAKMNAELAIELADVSDVRLVEAPIMEGAYMAAVESGMSKKIDEIEADLNKEFPSSR